MQVKSDFICPENPCWSGSHCECYSCGDNCCYCFQKQDEDNDEEGEN